MRVPFWAFYRAVSYDGSVLRFWVSLLKLILFTEMYPECGIVSWDALILLLDADNIE